MHSYESYHEIGNNNHEVEVAYSNGREIRTPRVFKKVLSGMSWKTESQVVDGRNGP